MSDPELIGRDEELAVLARALDGARAGRGGLVVVTGEAGIGKSALAAAAVAQASGSGFAVSLGRAWEIGQAPAYFPVRPCLRSLGAAIDLPGSPSPGDAATFQLWEEVLEALAHASARRPVLWVVEDLHAADAQTLDLLAFLAQPLQALAALLLVTVRSPDPRLEGPILRRVTRLERDGTHLALDRLSEAQVGSLAERVAGARLPHGALADLTRRTAGNPLFITECARVIKKRNDSNYLHLPATLVQVVAERVDLLPAPARALLGFAAVLGDELSVAPLARMSDQLPARAIDELAPALRAGILVELDPGRFRFSHALVREAIAARATREERADAHRRAEAALASLGETPDLLVDRALHALAALSPDFAPRALELAERATALLERQGTFDRAFALHRRLLDVRRAGELPPATARDLLRGAELALGAGRFGDSRTLSLEAAAVARAADHPDDLAAAALSLGADLRPGFVDRVLVEHLEAALARLPPEPTALRIRVSARLAAALQPARDPLGPVQLARRAIADARPSANEDLLAETLLIGGSAIYEFTDVKETRDLARELLALALRRNEPVRALRAWARLVLAEGELGDWAALDTHLDEMLAAAQRIGHPRHTWRPLLLGSMRAIARGDFDQSDRWIAEVGRLEQLTDDPALSVSLQAHSFHRGAIFQDEATIRAGITELSRSKFPIPPFILAVTRARVAVRSGNDAAAVPEMRELAFEPYRERSSSLGGLGEIYAAAATDDQRRALRAAIAPYADRDIFSGHVAMTYDGPTRRALGLLDASLGHTDQALVELGAALAQSRARGLRYWVARIAFEIGTVLARAGRTAEARPHLEEAASLSASIGDARLADRARRALAPADEAPRDPAPVDTEDSLAMAREGDVWRITHGGRSLLVQDSRGLELLARLVERPREEVHVLVLAGAGDAALTESSAGDALDERAAREYRDRLRDLDDEIAAAEARSDLGQTERLAAEREFLRAELARAFGLGGAARRSGSVTERARVNVQRRLKGAIDRIEALDAPLGRYLRDSIRTGTYCTYRP